MRMAWITSIDWRYCCSAPIIRSVPQRIFCSGRFSSRCKGINMNKSSLFLATLLGFAAISAQAGELYPSPQFQDPASTLTRAQVKQTVLQERKAGELDHNDVDLPGNGTLMTPADQFGKTRAAAQA